MSKGNGEMKGVLWRGSRRGMERESCGLVFGGEKMRDKGRHLRRIKEKEWGNNKTSNFFKF